MPRNSSGTYTLPAGNPVVSGTLIEASWANTTLSDLASSMTDSLSRSGEGGMTAALRLYDGTSSVPGLAFSNETSSGLYRAGAGDLRLAVTGADVMQWLSTGVAITGTLSASGNTTLSGTLAVTGAATFSGQTVTLENSTAYYPQLVNRNKTNDANGSYISLQKIRSTSIVQNGDVLGNVIFSGYDGAAYLQGAYVNAVVSATPGTNDMPTDLVFGTTADGGAGPTERFRITNAGDAYIRGGKGLAWYDSTNTNYWAQYNSSGSFILSNGTARMTVDSNGNVGIGTSTFNGVRSVIQGSQTGGAPQTTGTTQTYGLLRLQGTSFTSALDFGTNGGNYAWIQSTDQANLATNYSLAINPNGGNVGIGTSSPSQKLHVSGGLLQVTRNTQNMFLNPDYNSGGTTSALVVDTGKVLAFMQADTERARIDSSGNLLVGKTAPSGSTVGGEVRPDGQIYAVMSSSTASASTLNVYSTGAGAYRFYVGMDGRINATLTTVNAISDVRFKENIRDLEDGLNVVMALRPRKFDWKEGKGADIKNARGFIAQEFETVLPDLVNEWKDPAPEGEEPYKSICPDLIPTLVKAIQEQQAIIEGLTARITALEATP